MSTTDSRLGQRQEAILACLVHYPQLDLDSLTMAVRKRGLRVNKEMVRRSANAMSQRDILTRSYTTRGRVSYSLN